MLWMCAEQGEPGLGNQVYEIKRLCSQTEMPQRTCISFLPLPKKAFVQFSMCLYIPFHMATLWLKYVYFALLQDLLQECENAPPDLNTPETLCNLSF